MTIETIVYAGVVIMGAIIVAFAAVLIIKSTSKKGIAQTQQQLVENIETPVVREKRRTPTLKLGLNRLKFPLRLGLKALIGQRRNAFLDKESSDEETAIEEQFSIQLPKAFLDKESSDEETAIEEQFSTQLPNFTASKPEPNDIPSSPDQETPNVAPPDEEEPAVNIINTSPEETAEPAQDWPREEPEETDEASDTEDQEQPANKDTAFDLFATEIVEESDVSKLAASLSNLDAHDLLQEAQNLMNVLRGTGK